MRPQHPMAHTIDRCQHCVTGTTVQAGHLEALVKHSLVNPSPGADTRQHICIPKKCPTAAGPCPLSRRWHSTAMHPPSALQPRHPPRHLIAPAKASAVYSPRDSPHVTSQPSMRACSQAPPSAAPQRQLVRTTACAGTHRTTAGAAQLPIYEGTARQLPQQASVVQESCKAGKYMCSGPSAVGAGAPLQRVRNWMAAAMPRG
jgi:hypothetical protein